MDGQPKRPGSITFWLVGVVLMVGLTVYILAPLHDCPRCYGTGGLDRYEGDPAKCDFCRGKGKVSLWHEFSPKSSFPYAFESEIDLLWRMVSPANLNAITEKFLPAEVVWGDDEGDARTLTYIDVDTKYSKSRLWFEPKSSKLLKHANTFALALGLHGTRTTTYSEFTLNADIPDEKFKLPEEKK